MILDAIDGWDDYPRRIFDREATIRGIAEWIDAESSVMPYAVLRCDGVSFRVAVRDYEEQDLILAADEYGHRSAAGALGAFGELIDTAKRRMEGKESWPEGPALDEIRLYQKEREVEKLNTMATLFIQREPHIVNEIEYGAQPGQLDLDAASLPECLWDEFEAEGEAFKLVLEEEIYHRVNKK